jgi:hypothetical protein
MCEKIVTARPRFIAVGALVRLVDQLQATP